MPTAMSALAVATLLAALASAVPLQHEATERDSCGYASCPALDPNVINVHIVPHTHDDVGWLKTVDQYYYGSKNNIQKAGVQYILDSVVKELWEDPKRRFIYVETAFFWKWWQRQHDAIRHKVHTLVRQGRLEFIGGAWSMNDEADVHYQSTIDQFTWGLRKLNETFGECGRPRVGWQIDPFGHSRELASLLAAMGYDGLFLGRIDYQDKMQRMRDRAMEMVWRGDDDLGAASDLFTGVLFNTYSPPPGFCFDVLCQDEPIIDDPDSPMFNVDERVDEFLNFTRIQSAVYRSNNIILTMGGDFTYMDAMMWYTNLDLLIRHANMKAAKDKLNVNLFYSTPSCYLKAVHDARPTLPIKQDDFFPYASDPHAYWTGYFTSRPTLKYFERRGNAYLQMVKQLQVLAHLEEHNRFIIDELRSAMGVMQHHDAVTGTEKQHVADDYARILDDAIEDGMVIIKQAISKLSQKEPYALPELNYTRCQLNVSECAVSERSRAFVLTVYNPLAWRVSAPVRVPVAGGDYTVREPSGSIVESQLIALPAELLALPTRHSRAVRELVFMATELPPLGYRSYYVQGSAGRRRRQLELLRLPEESPYMPLYTQQELRGYPIEHESDAWLRWSPYATIAREHRDGGDASRPRRRVGGAREQQFKFGELSDMGERMLGDAPTLLEAAPAEDFIENEHLRVNIDRSTGDFTSIVRRDGPTLSFDLDLLYYVGCAGNNEVAQNRSSGAYIFRPNGTRATSLRARNTTVIKGPVVQEVRQAYGDFASAVLRLYKDSEVLEFEWLVGPIPVDDKAGKEVVVRYHTNVSNRGVFYTDSNGRQSLKRILNERPQWHLNLAEPVAGNYYPVTSKIYIEDPTEDLRFTVLNDRAQGGSSLEDGQVELMLHRRLLHDDAFGVGEALNETARRRGLVARGRHYLSWGAIGEARRAEKAGALEALLPPETFAADASKIPYDAWAALRNEWSGLRGRLPEGAHLLTLEPWRGGSLLLRLEHVLERADAGANGTLTVDLAGLFADLNLTSVREASLAANQWTEDREPLLWEREAEFVGSFNEAYGGGNVARGDAETQREKREAAGLRVELEPKEIKTFVIEYV